MTLGRFALVLFGLLALTAGAASLFGIGRLDGAQWTAAIYGGAVATGNAFAAFGVMQWARSRPTKAFLTAVFGGMAVRMAAMLVAVLLAVAVLKLPTVPLLVGLLGYFVLFLVLEMVAVQMQGTAVAGAR